jgi:hypothetical protein
MAWSASAAVAAACERRFRLYESFTVRSPASSAGAPKASPTRRPASEYDFDSVRSTTTFARRRTIGSAVAAAKSTYASSTTSTPGRRAASASISSIGTSVPDGEFGLQRNVSFGPRAPRAGGSDQSAGHATVSQTPPCTATSVS